MPGTPSLNPVSNVDVVLPAAGRIDGEFAQEAGHTLKALIEFGGETMLARTIRCARAVTSGRIVVVGPPEITEHPSAKLADLTAPEGTSAPDNVLNGIAALKNPTEHLLCLPTDQPFLSPNHVHDWMVQTDPRVDIVVSLVRQEAFSAAFPEAPATMVKLRDGAVTTGGVFLARTTTVPTIKASMDRIFANRKSKLGMARLLGFSFVVRWLTNQLVADDVLTKVESLFNCKGQLVRDGAPELAFDIDLLEEYRYARALWDSGRR